MQTARVVTGRAFRWPQTVILRALSCARSRSGPRPARLRKRHAGHSGEPSMSGFILCCGPWDASQSFSIVKNTSKTRIHQRDTRRPSLARRIRMEARHEIEGQDLGCWRDALHDRLRRVPDRAALNRCESCLQAGAPQLFCRFPPFTVKRLKCARFFVIGETVGCVGIDLSVRSIAYRL